MDCRKISTEDCRTGGSSFSENVGVGGDVEHHLCVESLESWKQKEISSHMSMSKIAIQDMRNQA